MGEAAQAGAGAAALRFVYLYSHPIHRMRNMQTYRTLETPPLCYLLYFPRLSRTEKPTKEHFLGAKAKA